MENEKTFDTNGPVYDDIEIRCMRCQRPFLWTAGDQEFYFERGLVEPKYCKSCRTQRKAEYKARKAHGNQ